MEEDIGNHQADIHFSFEWSGKEISYYEDAVEFVKSIEDGKFYETFNQLFPTPDIFNNFDFRPYNDSRERLREFQEKYQADWLGGLVFIVLHTTFNLQQCRGYSSLPLKR